MSNAGTGSKIRVLNHVFCTIGVLTLLICVFPNVYAQNVTVSHTLTDGTGTAFRTAYLHFALNNCGSNFPTVTTGGIQIVVQDSFDIHPPVLGGAISGSHRRRHLTTYALRGLSHFQNQGQFS